MSQLILSQLLLPESQAINTLQRVIIGNSLIVDVPYTFSTGSELVFTDDASMEVNATLKLNGCYIHGCEKLWNGIFVRDGGFLTATSNCILDSYKAIRLYNGAKYEIFNNTFKRNFISIDAGRPDLFDLNPAYIYPVGKGISGNQFFGGDLLIEPFQSFSNPAFAIRAQSVSELYIGGNQLNVIQGYFNSSFEGVPSGGTGIYASNTYLTVINTKFSNMGIIENATAGYGILAYDGNVSVTGIGKTNTSATFQNCDIGIQVQNCVLNVTECFFDYGYNHIKYYFQSTPFKYDISSNRFKSYVGRAISGEKGVYIKCKVENNIFENDVNVPSGLFLGDYRRSALFAEGSFGAQPQGSIYKLEVTGNRVTDVQKPTFSSMDALSGGDGFVIKGIKNNSYVHDNLLFQNHTDATPHFFNGVLLDGSSGSKVYNNILMSSAAYSLTSMAQVSGIKVNETSGSLIKCNTLTGLKNGIDFKGACDATTLYANSFTNNNNALLLATGNTRIGQQNKNHNTWPGITLLPKYEARWLGNPSPLFINLSKVLVEYFETPTSKYWANPRQFGGWFVPANGATVEPTEVPLDYCTNEDKEVVLTASDEAIISNTYPIYKGYGELTWEAAYDLYERLQARPDLRPSGSAAANFYNGHANTNLGKLHSAMLQYGSIAILPATIEVQWDNTQSQIGVLMDQINANHTAMLQAVTVSQKEQLNTALQGLSTQLQALKATMSTLTNTHLMAKQTKYNQLQIQLNAISTTAGYEATLKSVLSILGSALATTTDGKFTAAQIATLGTIAAQCRFSGGYGVVLARSVLNKPLDLYDDEALCPGGSGLEGGSDGRSSMQINADRVMLSPNPGTDMLLVTVGSTFQSGQLYVYDLMGKLVQSTTIGTDQSNSILDISMLPLGAYSLRVELDGKPFAIKRFVKIN